MTKILHIPSGEYVKFVSRDQHKLVLNIEDSWLSDISLDALFLKLEDTYFNLNIKGYDDSQARIKAEFEVIDG